MIFNFVIANYLQEKNIKHKKNDETKVLKEKPKKSHMKLNSNLKTESDSQSEIFIQSSYSF